MPPAEYRKLPCTLQTINVSGGEPFIRTDLVSVVESLHEVSPGARLVFSTNGYMTDRIVSTIAEIRRFHDRIGVGVSLDGTEATHDRIRGVEGIFSKARETIKKLKESGESDLRIAMTIMPENVSEIEAVFRMATAMDVEFTATVAHNSDIYFRKGDNVGISGVMGLEQGLRPVVLSQLKSRRIKDWYRAYHMSGLFSPDIRMRYVAKCEAGRKYVFIAPNGDVYPCNVLEEKMFNLTQVKSWDEGYTSDVRARIAGVVKACRRDCWMVCNTRSLILSHPLQASAWVLRNKINSRK